MSPPVSPKQQLEIMLQEKATPCVSIIVPFLSKITEPQMRKIHVEKAIQAACDELLNNNLVNGPLITSLNCFSEEMSFDFNAEGIGIFVSENIKFSTSFPFTVMEKIIVSNAFELRELLFKQQCTFPYNVLYMDDKQVRLFNGNLNQLHEIRNKAFPLEFTDRCISGGLFSVHHNGHFIQMKLKQDEAQIKKLRRDNFYHEIDELVSPYIEEVDTLIVAGDKKLTSAFINRTRHLMKISSVINDGPYYDSHYEEDYISNMIWPVIEAHIKERMKEQVDAFKAKKGEGQTEEGLVNVWNAVWEERSFKLIVEKDYHQKAFTKKPYSYIIYLNQPKQPHQLIEDAVEKVISSIMKNNGEVCFVENGMLSDHEQIGLFTDN